MAIKTLKHGIKVIKWKRASGKSSWIFANSNCLIGRLILRFRGYKPHKTILGTVFRKDL